VRQRITELELANRDLAGLVEGAQIAAILVDGQLCLRHVTAAAAAPFQVIESDIGRRLNEVAPGLARSTTSWAF
jgi:hypothetical protein